LPHALRIGLPGGVLCAVHGERFGRVAERHSRLRSAFAQDRAVVYGHTHRWVVDDTAYPWILNPGACGRTRTFGGPSLLVLTAAPDGWTVAVQRYVL
jgi:predicted phosphodiesterase